MGPVDRGDTVTIKNHIDAITNVSPSVIPLYRELVRQNITLAKEHQTITPDKAAEMLDLIINTN